MALATWPTSVPHHPAGGVVRSSHHRPLVTTEVEDGPDLMRVQSQTKIKTLQYQLAMTNAQFVTFESFVEDTLDQGSQHFTMPIVDVDGTCEDRRVYIEGGQWSDSPLGPRRMVSFNLCVFPAA